MSPQRTKQFCPQIDGIHYIIKQIPFWVQKKGAKNESCQNEAISGSFSSWSDELSAGVIFYAVNNTTVGKF